MCSLQIISEFISKFFLYSFKCQLNVFLMTINGAVKSMIGLQDCAILSEFAIITGQYIKKLSKLSVYSQLLFVQ